MLAQGSNRSERWLIKTCSNSRCVATERTVLFALPSEPRVTVSDLPSSFSLLSLCDVVASETGSVWEEFFPWLWQGVWSLCFFWGVLEQYSSFPRRVHFGNWQWLGWCQEATFPGEVWVEQDQFSSNGRRKSYSSSALMAPSWRTTAAEGYWEALKGERRGWTGTKIPHSSSLWAFHSLGEKEHWYTGSQSRCNSLDIQNINRAGCWCEPTTSEHRDGSRKRSNFCLCFK